MGIWEWINSPINAVKQNTPDLTPATDICQKSFEVCRGSTVHVASAAATKARDFRGYLPDGQVRDNLSNFAVNVSKNSALYIARYHVILNRQVKTPKNCTEENMGIWEWIYSPINAVKQNTPDLTPAKDICQKSFEVCRGSTVRVASAAATKARDFHGYLSDVQVRDNLSNFAVNVSKNSALYIARSHGGGPIIDILSRSVQGLKSESHKGRIKDFETKLAKLEKELSSTQLEIQRLKTASKSQDESDLSIIPYQRPEDVPNNFMKEQSLGGNLFDNLIIPTDVNSKR